MLKGRSAVVTGSTAASLPASAASLAARAALDAHWLRRHCHVGVLRDGWREFGVKVFYSGVDMSHLEHK